MRAQLLTRRSNQIALAAVVVVVAVVVGLLGLTGITFERAQQLKYREFRSQLADGTAPIDSPVSTGSPVAIIKAPSIGLDAVVLEGSDTGTLQHGIGHLRSSTLPGQSGTSVLLGRKSLFGGVFEKVPQLKVGDKITVVSAQGETVYTVKSTARYEATDAAAFAPSGNSVRLITATSSLNGGERVSVLATADASTVYPVGARGVIEPVSADELGMNFDHNAAGSVLAWLQVMILALFGATYLVHRWGWGRAWIFVSPVCLAIGVVVTLRVAALLPGLA